MSENVIEGEIKTKDIISENISKEIVYEKIFNAYNYGNLGMFIGAGFSKAVIGNEDRPALNWIELIKKASERLKLELPKDEDLKFISLPQLSTILCKRLAMRKNISYEEAKAEFKNIICDLSNWLPSEEKEKCFRKIFDIINPKWIITTNYDLVLETILTGKSKGLSPFNYLSAPRGVIPIYHFHGTRLDPDSIIITQDDYIPLFRPNEYRQAKLAMTIRESTTLVLGYNLGDINVLSALDWSKNIYTKEYEYPYEVIQVLWTSKPKEDAYKDENGNIVIEVDDLETFLEELSNYLLLKETEYKEKLDKLSKILVLFEGDNSELVEKFITQHNFRVNLLKLVSEFEYNMMYSYIEFFMRCINKVWLKTDVNGAFDAYDDYLKILLDIIIYYKYVKIPPRLFEIVAKALNKVFEYIRIEGDFYPGYSHPATKTWCSMKKNIPQDMVRQLHSYAEQNCLSNLKKFTKELITK